jgi:hypothetical protein
MKGILSDTSLSSNGNKSSSLGLGGQDIPFRTDNLGILFSRTDAKQVLQIHSAFSTDCVAVRNFLLISSFNFALSTFETLSLNHVW